MQEEAGGQAALAAAGRSQPDDVLPLGHVVETVEKRHDLLAVQLRLAGEGEGLDLQHLGDVGPFAAQQPGVLDLDAVLRLQHVLQQPLVGETPAAGLGQQLVPMGQQPAETEIFQDLPQFFIHLGSRFLVRRLGVVFPRRFVIDGQVRLVGQEALLVGRTLAEVFVLVHQGQGLLSLAHAQPGDAVQRFHLHHAIAPGPREGLDEHGSASPCG